MVESMWGRFSAIAVLFLCLTVTLTGGSPSAWAACTSPSKAAGDVVYNASEKTFQYCSDTVWKAMNLPGSGSGGCTNPARAEGEIIYNTDHRVMQGCAGNVWRAIGEGGTDEWVQMSTGLGHACGIKEDQTLWCWGENNQGQLGDGTTTTRALPVQVEPGTQWTHIAAGGDVTCALKTNGTAWCWGFNGEGQLGDGTNNDSMTPVQVSGGGSWTHVTSGVNLSGNGATVCAIKSDQSLWCWGSNNAGQLADGTTNASNIPVEVDPGSSWKWIEIDEGGPCGIKADGSAWCWGAGPLGNGTSNSSMTPVQISGTGTWQNLGKAGSFACAVSVKGEIYCWGNNSGNALTQTDRSAAIRTSGRDMQCTNPTGRPGKMIYNETEKAMQYCNSVGWTSINFNPTTPSYIPTNNLLAYWAFDESAGTTAADSSGNGHVGTLNNMDPMTDWVAGKVGNALDFDGSNDYVSFINDIPFAYGYFSIAGWFYVRGTGGVDDEFPIFMQRDFDTGNGQSTVGIVVRNSNKKVHAQIRDDVDTLIQCIGSTTITWNNWYHFAVVRTSDNIKLYINGVQDCSTNFSRWGSFSANIAVREIGRHTNSSGTGGIANGRIDELRVYNRVLSLSEIQALAAQ